jgi:hypothetical protein
MCIAAWYCKNDKNVITHFCAMRAVLPIQNSQINKQQFIIWGRRNNEYGQLPKGASVSLESVKSNQWRHYSPVLVKIPITKFMEHDLNNHAEWFDIPKGQLIQGIVLQHKAEKRCYIISSIKHLAPHVYLHWPNIVY